MAKKYFAKAASLNLKHVEGRRKPRKRSNSIFEELSSEIYDAGFSNHPLVSENNLNLYDVSRFESFHFLPLVLKKMLLAFLYLKSEARPEENSCDFELKWAVYRSPCTVHSTVEISLRISVKCQVSTPENCFFKMVSSVFLEEIIWDIGEKSRNFRAV